jgi:hypothetical protein
VKRNFAAVLVCICVFSFRSAAQVDRPCWTATDAANWAQELTEKSPRSELQDVLSYLTIGTERCRDEKVKADAWYFRGLLEKHLGGNAQLADRYISRGRDGGSRPAIENQPLFGNKRDNSKPATARPVREKWAVVVGIGQFQSSAIPSLRYTGKDARDFAKVLTDPEVGRFKPENVQTLTDKDATLVNIRKAIGSIRDKAQADDLVMLYISSHGSPRTIDPRGISYVLVHDSDITGADTIYATGLAMTEIVNTLNRDIRAERLILVLDTCFSGAAAPGAKALIPVSAVGLDSFSGAFSQFQAAGWAALAASKGDQKSWESEELQQGYFTYYLIEALKESHGAATVQELYTTVQGKVSGRVRQDKGQEQTPVMSSGSEGSKLVLGVKAS